MTETTNETITEEQLKQEFDDLYMHIFKYIGDFVSIPTQKYNLTFEAYMVMENVARSKNGQTLVELAKLEGVSKSAIARQVNVLLKENYVMQKVDPNDRRVKYITLTAAGSRVQRNLSQATAERFHRWLGFFGRDEKRNTLLRCCIRPTNGPLPRDLLALIAYTTSGGILTVMERTMVVWGTFNL